MSIIRGGKQVLIVMFVAVPNNEHDSKVRINVERLWGDIMATARWGAISGTNGLARLALSKDDKLARDWFVRSAQDIGCQVKVDAIGNIFAILPGRNMSVPPIAMGSHLDTQPAGKYCIS